MQGVFEKIIEKLEERSSFLSDCTKYGNKDTKQQNKSYSTMMMYEVADLVDDLIEIVKQVSEQYQYSEYGFVSKSEVLKVIEDIKCNDDIPKNYGTLLDIMRKIRNMPTVDNNGWIPRSEPPKDDRYVLLSFDNFSVPMVGRYEEDEKGGSYYIGDEMEPCVTQDIFVNAWQPLPESYKPKGE